MNKGKFNSGSRQLWTKACIFDLDGVLVDTARYHFLAWKRLTADLGIKFTEADNEHLKGVSRMASLEIILKIGGKNPGQAEKEKLAALKNEWYLEYIEKMTPEEILPGTLKLINDLKNENIKVALGSASRNTPLILKRLELENIFDAIADGNSVHKAKPDPEVFLKAAGMMSVEANRCVVFEDAYAGVEAALRAGMICIGIGEKELLKDAHMVIKGLFEMDLDKLSQLEARLHNEKLS
jgi:beta-phosphoglucomutase